MKQIRISGIVSLANRVRRELAHPVSPERLAVLNATVRSSLVEIDRLLEDAGGTAESLPLPSRRAYQFLAGLDFDAVKTDTTVSGRYAPGTVSFPGLRKHFQRLLRRLAEDMDAAEVDRLANSIRKTSESIEKHIVSAQLGPEHLTEETRLVRGWLGYFADPDALGHYVKAVALARPILRDAVGQRADDSSMPSIQFRPMTSLFQLKTSRSAARIDLPTPMIGFTETQFQDLADLIPRRGQAKPAIIDALRGDACQTIRESIDLLSGLVEQVRGVHHDLNVAFDRVNTAYFNGQVSRPKLFWSRGFTHRTFGYYDHLRDAVMISATLDRHDVPAYVVDSIVYHELLHKTLGIAWKNGRKAVHTAEFQKAMRRFREHDQAEAVLKRLASGE